MSSHSILSTPGNNRYKVNEKIQFNQQQEILLFTVGTIVGIGFLYLVSRQI
jgi:hypothetical protein